MISREHYFQFFTNNSLSRPGGHRDARPVAVLRAAVRRVQEIAGINRLQTDVLPLLPAGVLPGPADGHRQLRGVQGCPTGFAVSSSIYVVTIADDGLLEGIYNFVCVQKRIVIEK